MAQCISGGLAVCLSLCTSGFLNDVIKVLFTMTRLRRCKSGSAESASPGGSTGMKYDCLVVAAAVDGLTVDDV